MTSSYSMPIAARRVEHLRGPRRSVPLIVSPRDPAVVGDRVERGLGHRVDGVRGDELDHVHRVVVGRVLDAGGGPQRTLLRSRRPPSSACPAVGRDAPSRSARRRAGRWRCPPCRAARLASSVPILSSRLSISVSTRDTKNDATERIVRQVDAGCLGLLQAGEVGVHDLVVAVQAEDQRDVDADAGGGRRGDRRQPGLRAPGS